MVIEQKAQVASPATVPRPGPDAGQARPLPAGRRLDWTLLAPAAATLLVMLWGIATPSYWRDESATLSSADRSLPQLLRMLGRVNAVHGLYYFLMWPVVHFIGSREFDTRLPSAIAMAAAALGVAAIGRRVRSRRAGLYAGLVFAALPLVAVRGHDARPYAPETAAAVLATYLLLRAAERPSWRRFAGERLHQEHRAVPCRARAAGRRRVLPRARRRAGPGHHLSGRVRRAAGHPAGPDRGAGRQLAGTSLPLPVIQRRLTGVRRLWVVEESEAWLNPPLRLRPGFRLALSWQRNQMWVRLYVRSEGGH